MDFPILEFLKALLKGLAYVAENFPDNPRLGRKLLFAGAVLVSTILAPTSSPEWGDLVLILQVLCVIAGGVCLLLGAFVFFRRWVWRRQDKRTPVVTSLNLK
ncbi:MAG TPA: hypothetical protein VE263_04935 [Candidatus Angelobacter sp.]|nr:hypothetical protein [Candidatus Angelobacter sp.]